LSPTLASFLPLSFLQPELSMTAIQSKQYIKKPNFDELYII